MNFLYFDKDLIINECFFDYFNEKPRALYLVPARLQDFLDIRKNSNFFPMI